jgi:hypothetical protein
LWPTSNYGLEQYPQMSDAVRVEEVRVARLDTILESVVSHIPAPRIFLKLDTQGSDMNVFRGAGASLGRIAGLQAELHFREVYVGAPMFREALAELRAGGFELTGLFPVSHGERLVLIEADCIMVNTSMREDRPPDMLERRT